MIRLVQKCASLSLFGGLLLVSAAYAQQVPISPPSPTAPPALTVGSAPASTEEIVAAAQDCAAVISPGQFDRDTFRERGWIIAGRPTTRETRPGMTTQSAMFGRQGGQVLNIINVTGNLLVHCSVVARAEAAAQHAAVRTALIAALDLTPASETIAEERDRLFSETMPEVDRVNLLLSPVRRITVRLDNATIGPVIRIEIFPKRPLES